MKLFKSILNGVVSLSVLAGSFSAVSVEAKPYHQVSAKEAVQHIFFKDSFGGNKLNVHLIKVDLNNPMVSLDLALAYNNTNRKEKVSKIAQRVGAIAAINGSFFHSRSSIDSAVGILMADGVVLADSGHRRSSIGITEDKKVIIGIPKINNFVVMPELGVSLKLNGINQVRGKNHNTVYTSFFGARTKTKGSGREIMVNRDGRILGYKLNNAPIPNGGFVISMSKANSSVIDKYPLGSQAYIDSIESAPWNRVRTIITGSPQLVKNGKIYNTYSQERLQSSIRYSPTRTAVGITSTNKLLMLTVSGGLTFTKLAQIMKRLGAKDALAFDGGGSTDMYIKGKNVVTNYRPVTNALVVKMNKG
ncbi:MAG: phosphodiester glycosidase family protein [Candidatus Sericytochromatia bacterium]|nr:phosphodiester glycosidase family protein [Candidatus Sericytochromatia bacterium]